MKKTYKVKIIRDSIVEAQDEEEAKDLAFDSMIYGDVDFEVEEEGTSNKPQAASNKLQASGLTGPWIYDIMGHQQKG